jgi:hypothetical protein
VSIDDDLAALRLLNSLLANPDARASRAALDGVGGTLTPEMLARALEEERRPARADPLPPRPVLPWGYRDLLEDFAAGWLCPVRLFAPDPYCGPPVQGPAPLRCELEPHPEGTWHRDGRTWWR